MLLPETHWRLVCRTSLTHYTPNTGTTALKKAIIAKLASENGLTYEASEIVISNGAKQSIWQAILAAVSPGDEVSFYNCKDKFRL